MATDVRQDAPPSAVASQLRYTMGLVCKDSFTIKEIDGLFIYSGADEEWWTEPLQLQSSSRVNRVNGWFEGIRRHAPEREVAILRQVCEKFLANADIDQRHREAVAMVIAGLDGTSPRPVSGLDRYNLDPRVVQAAGKLFDGGHYRQAVLDTYIALNVAVKRRAERPDRDGTAMMQQVFSVKNPILSLSDDHNEQQGNMNLFARRWRRFVIRGRTPWTTTTRRSSTRRLSCWRSPRRCSAGWIGPRRTEQPE